MAGLYAIVGPSGVGKDTLMEAAKARMPDLHLVRRVITRPSDAGGEAFEGVSEAEFQTRVDRGDFVLFWRAHGLRYGVPGSVADILDAGGVALFNGSRGALAEAQQAFPALKVIHVTARPEVLAARLAARGRESAEDIERRLKRAALPLPAGLDVTELDNSGDLEDAVTRLLDVLQPVKA